MSGAHVLPILAVIIMGVASGATAFLSYRAATVHAEGLKSQVAALSASQFASLREHQTLNRTVNELSDIQEQTMCLLSMLKESERREALRSGDVCVYLGVKPRSPRYLPHELDRDGMR